jgi:LuxR family maltose regulon positive regulatory protein
MQGQKDNSSFIQSFSGSHHFVLDYLLEEVLQQQSESIQSFLLFTSILDRLCGPLCDAVILDPSTPGQETLAYLANANLFIVPLDNERRWYRYYHLFAELLQQRLHKLVSSTQYDGVSVNKLHIRASQWYENGGYEAEAFHHAAAAGEVDRAMRLVEGKGLPLYARGALVPVLKWLESLPEMELDKRPALWVIYARALTAAGQPGTVEEKLQAAEAALQDSELDAETRDLIGTIASLRATLAYTKYQPDTVIVQAQRALEYLSPDNLTTRSMTTLALGVGYMQKGNRAEAIQSYEAARSGSQKIGDNFGTSIATMALGNMYEMENKLYLAAETQRQALQLFGAVPINIAYESHLGLARIFYQWNDLDRAQHHGEKSVHLARQYDETIDRYIICEVFLTYLKLAQGDVAGAAALLTETNQSVQQYNYFHRIPEVAAAQMVLFLHQGKLEAAADLAKKHELPLSQARVHLAAGEPKTALAVLEPWRRQVEVRGWQDERLKVMVLQAIALQAHGEKDKAVQLLGEALALAAPGGFIRLFVDEGLPMAQLLSEAGVHGIMPDYVSKLLEAFETEQMKDAGETPILTASDSQPLIEPLSPRELEVLQLVAQGLSNREISERLFLALSTVKTHNRNIFGKLQVNRRTEAIVRARELGLL